jgi:hypothetical protein
MANALNIPTIPAFKLPPLVARLGARLPQWPHSINLALALNAARKLGVLPEESLQELEGKRFRVTVLDTGMVAEFQLQPGRLPPGLRVARRAGPAIHRATCRPSCRWSAARKTRTRCSSIAA